jgi:hypothetical protein
LTECPLIRGKGMTTSYYDLSLNVADTATLDGGEDYDDRTSREKELAEECNNAAAELWATLIDD